MFQKLEAVEKRYEELNKLISDPEVISRQNEWKNFEEKLKSLPSYTNKNVRDFIRYFLSGAVECELDKQGRFLIPSNLRNHAMLDKDIVIIGVGTKIEIWDRKEWKRYSNDDNISADEIAENLSNLGI